MKAFPFFIVLQDISFYCLLINIKYEIIIFSKNTQKKSLFHSYFFKLTLKKDILKL